jgi:hypothetical protein
MENIDDTKHRTPEENSFREGLQDNSVKLQNENSSSDPKSSITNRDEKITNEDDQKKLTDETDARGPDYGELIDKSPELGKDEPDPEIPDIHSPTYKPGKTNRELPELNEED